MVIVILRVVLTLIFTCFSTVSFAIELKGHLKPGGFAVGQVEPGAKVLLGNNQVIVGSDGTFVIGFGRDQGPSAQLTIVHIDGKTEQQNIIIAPRSYEIQRIDQLDQNMVTPDPATEARIKSEQAKVKASRSNPSDRRDFLTSFVWPVQGPISGVYGSQRILNGVPKAPHFGTDIAAPEGTPIVAPAGGTIRLAEAAFYLTGGTVIIDHGLGIYSSYLHMSWLGVKKGQEVKQGDTIGRVGKTGRVTGPHLHWGLNWNEIRLDPALIVPPMP